MYFRTAKLIAASVDPTYRKPFDLIFQCVCKMQNGWGGWIRTTTVCINSAASYQLDHAPVEAHIIMRGKGLLHNGGFSSNFLKDAGASSGASWTLLLRLVEPLHGCQRVFRGKVRIPDGHPNALVAE